LKPSEPTCRLRSGSVANSTSWPPACRALARGTIGWKCPTPTTQVNSTFTSRSLGEGAGERPQHSDADRDLTPNNQRLWIVQVVSASAYTGILVPSRERSEAHDEIASIDPKGAWVSSRCFARDAVDARTWRSDRALSALWTFLTLDAGWARWASGSRWTLCARCTRGARDTSDNSGVQPPAAEPRRCTNECADDDSHGKQSLVPKSHLLLVLH